ncbi:MAG TPA: hypothetical protein VE224_17260 [Pseudolabrys sp.]|nr:hypothetical protein [Pseudolabrys sp.]
MARSKFGVTAMYARSRPVVECPSCGARLYVPDRSDYVDATRVRHQWQCEECGATFETMTEFAAA